MNAQLCSAVYEGRVRHRRLVPQPHAFCYRIAQLCLDLEEIDRALSGRWLWSSRRRNVAEFRRSDYLRPSALPLDEAVRRLLAEHMGRRPEGPIRLLAHLRYAGYVFNPVSFYYCFEADGRTLAAIVAEITNTPWKERHAYVLPLETARRRGPMWEWVFPKTFHVSPFLPVACEYRWRFTAPGARLHVHMEVWRGGVHELDADLHLRRRPLTGVSLARVLWRYPLMTAQVIGAIHWQALRLWCKRTPLHPHPRSRGQS